MFLLLKMVLFQEILPVLDGTLPLESSQRKNSLSYSHKPPHKRLKANTMYHSAGGYFSTTNDMAKIGKAILNSTPLPQAQTRRWLKAATLTADVNLGVGSPWEIFRTRIGGRTVDLYTKNGGWG